jgi:hypothetical protein
MLRVVIGLILILIGIAAFMRRGQPQTAQGPQGRAAAIAGLFSGSIFGVIAILAGLAFLASTSFVLIPSDRVGQLNRI